MIKSFRDSDTEKVFGGRFSKRLPHDIQRVAERKLIMLHRAATLNDLQYRHRIALNHCTGIVSVNTAFVLIDNGASVSVVR